MSIRTVSRCALALLATLACSAAHAQIFRAYLAIDGNDANPCTLAAPCRLLPAALTAVASGGEIWMLDSANYNTATVVVGKSVTILAVPGVVGSVVAAGGPAISITASALKVTLRNLVIVPLAFAGGTDGVVMTGASLLAIERGVIANLPGHAVWVVGAGEVSITNSTIRNNVYGVLVEGGAQGEISGTKLRNNNEAVVAISTSAALTTLTLSDSVVSGGFGVSAYANGAGRTTRVNVSRSTIEGGSTALQSDASDTGVATISMSSSMIVNNLAAWSIVGSGQVVTFGNNHVYANTNAFGALSPVGLQ